MGWGDFALLGNRAESYIYVDKTMFIPELEKQPRISSSVFVVSVSSIFLSMLYSYYDCTQSHKFQSLFRNLWIGRASYSFAGKSIRCVPRFLPDYG